jgi:hypothetical protein
MRARRFGGDGTTQDTRPGRQLAAKARPGTHHAAKIRADQVYEIKIKRIYDLTRDATMQ